MKQIRMLAQYYVDLMMKLGLVRFSLLLALALVVLAIVTLLFVAMFQFYYIVAITGPLYFLSVYLAEDDAQSFDCYLIYKTKNDYYST